jgi:hypothetical protein
LRRMIGPAVAPYSNPITHVVAISPRPRNFA